MNTKFQKNKHQFINWEETFKWRKTNLGLTNENYLLDEKLLLRLSGKISNPFLQRENEIAMIRLLADKKINVPIVAYYYDDDGRFVYVSEFQENSKHFGNMPLTKNNLIKVATLIKKFHKIDGKNTNLTKIDMKVNLEHHISKAKKEYGSNMKVVIKKMFAFLETMDFSDLVISHNDLMKENVLINKNNEYFLIDFEYCSLNHRYYDFAVFVASTNMIDDKKMLKYWVSLIDADGDKDVFSKVCFLTLYRTLIGYYWANEMWEVHQNQVYYDLMILKWEQSQKCYQMIMNHKND